MCKIILFSPLPLTSLLPQGHIAGVAREMSVVVGELNCNIVVMFQPAPMTDQIIIAIRFRQLTLKKCMKEENLVGVEGLVLKIMSI